MSSFAIGASVSATRAAASLLSWRTGMRAPPRSSAGSLPGRWAKRPQTSSRSCSSSIIRLRRTSERTRAKSAMSLTGLVRKSSAPASSPVSRSAASDRAVTMTTGICAVVAAALANLLLVALHGEGGDGDDRNRAQLVVFLDPFRHLQPRYLGQLDIHQDQVGTMRTGDLERLHAVLRLQGVVTVRFEQVVEELHVELVILDDENGLRLGARPQGMHCLGSVHAAPVPMPPLDRRSFLNHHC